MNLIKVTIILALTCLFYIYYYKIHKKDITPILFVIVGLPVFIYGIFLFTRKIISFGDISLVYYITIIFIVSTSILECIGVKRKGMNKNVDITLTWLKKIIPFFPWYLWLILAFPAFFFFQITTYKLLGPEHIFLWIPIFTAWFASGIRLIKYLIHKLE